MDESNIKDINDNSILYGVESSSTASAIDIDITYSELESNIAILKSAVNTIKTNWEAANKTNINRLNSSWIGEDCEAYIKKVQEMDGQIVNSIAALKLLIETYEKARDQILEQQNKVTSKITNID